MSSTAIRAFAAALTTAAVATAGASTAVAAPTPATTSLQQHALVNWKNGNSAGKDTAIFSIPGIGYGEIVCRADDTHIRIYPDDRTRETSMWSIVGQEKNGAESWAVKNARIFTFATPTTPLIASGTGPNAQEGFNVENGVEDTATGQMQGLISQRSAFNQPGFPTAPSTAFVLEWKWKGLDGPVNKQRCKVDATFITKMPAGTMIKTKKAKRVTRSPGAATSETSVDWHGEADAALGKTEGVPAKLVSLGELGATCPTGRDSAAALTIKADDPAAPLLVLVQQYQGEGPYANTYQQFFTDPATGLLRVPLPTNGFLRLAVIGENQTGAVVTVSSWRQTNDEKPAENFCEIVAHAVMVPGASDDEGDPGPT